MLSFKDLFHLFLFNILWALLTSCTNRTIYNSVGQSPTAAIVDWVSIDENLTYGNGDRIMWQFDFNSNNPGPKYIACPGSRSTPVDHSSERNWLISNYYRTEAQSLHVQIQCISFTNFRLTDCRNASIFDIFILESDSPANLANSLSQFSAFESTSRPESDPILYADHNLTKSGFYVGFLNQGQCVGLSSFLFYYNICPAFTINMSSVPETAVPSPSQEPREVNISCPPRSLSRSRAECYSNSSWVLSPSCECEAGWRQLSNLSCAACPVDSFKESVGNARECVVCPSRSGTSGSTGSVSCGCESGFYRGEGEGVSVSCGRSPSAVRNIRVERESVSRAMLRVSWDEPVEVFNRSVSYNLSLYTRESGGDVVRWRGSSDNSWYDLTSSELEESREYVLVVTSLNNLVELSGGGNSENISFVSTFPLLSNFSLFSMGNDSFLEFLKELRGGVSNLSFELNYTSNVGVLMQASVNGCSLVVEDLFRCRAAVNNFNEGLDFVLTLNTFSELEIGERISIIANLKTQLTSTMTSSFSSSIRSTASESSQPRLSNNTIFYLILGGSVVALIVTVTAIIIFFVACCLCIKKPIKKMYGALRVSTKYTDAPTAPTPENPLYTDPSIFEDLRDAVHQFAKEVNNADITISRVIGNGEFGDVCAGTLNQEGNLISVALKTLKPNASEKSRRDFFLEASIMGQFDHENIIPLLGVTLSPPIMIVTPFMTNLSLDKFLQSKEEQLSVIQLGQLALGVTCGMVYLSSRSYVHRDLSARNILVDRDLTPKITDFGLSRVTEDDFYTMNKHGKVAVRWTALESILYYRFNSASDVWSFGILTWETMSYGAMPYEGMDVLNLVGKLQNGYRMPIPVDCPRQMYQLMLDCWEEDPDKRPSFPLIQSRLQDMIESHFGARRYGRLSKSYQDDPLSFSSVGDWLDSLYMSRYEEDFKENGFTSLNTIWRLNEQDLLRIGIIPLNHRNKIMTSIRKANRVLDRTKDSCTSHI